MEGTTGSDYLDLIAASLNYLDYLAAVGLGKEHSCRALEGVRDFDKCPKQDSNLVPKLQYSLLEFRISVS